ncbi:MAG TPA: GH116 family glycosyl-hydrolase [Bryobacteraceae bacterium]
MSTGRRGFLKGMAGGIALARSSSPAAEVEPIKSAARAARERVRYPRVFSGRQLQMIAFPLGGIGTGCISLSGRGQLRDWEIYNRPDKGRAPQYAFASIWVKSGNAKPIAHVLESRLMPPYASAGGLGPAGAPGLSRLESATFTGEFPLAQIAFRDARLPVRVSLEAFSPFIPLDPDSSGFPAAVLRYRVRNTGRTKATVSIAFSLENPVGESVPPSTRRTKDSRVNEFRKANANELQGLYMTNPETPEESPEHGSFALCLCKPGDGHVSYLRGWPAAKWWASPMLFWDDFGADGELGPEAEERKIIGSLCLQREIEPGADADYTFLLSWHFPNRTPAWSGWTAPKGQENAIIGNYYATQFPDAWAAAEQLAAKLPDLEKRTRSFVEAMRASTLPNSLRDAATANLSTLVTQTSFRTADGEFHGFEGCNDHRGCCFGNCTHVWNYETSTQFVFPSLAHSLRKAAFGYSEDEQGGMRFRQILPDGKDRFGYAAADGQMGQIIKTYLDWKLSADTEWLRGHWPQIQRAISFAWIPGGWDPNRDGVMEGVQHNTYDVEFYGPNPLCGIYYLGALRAAEEMARVLGDTSAAANYRGIFEKGRAWIDANLFNGEYYIQKVRSIPRDRIAPTTVGDMGADRPEAPEFQLGDGCLADQLIGQYLADMAGLGPLLDPAKIRKALESIHKYNYRPNLFTHDSVQRVYALNDEPAILVCDYGKGSRPKIPFPYYAEAWTGIEYLVAAQFIHAGMLREGLQTIEDVRWRFDGERRNPWDEPECGHHYARAMSAWSSVVAWSGFDYHAGNKTLQLSPKTNAQTFTSFWSAGSGWGLFSLSAENGRTRLKITVTEGLLPLQTIHHGKSSLTLKDSTLVTPSSPLNMLI